MLQQLRTVIYHVNDLAKAKEWYIALTGVQPYFDEPFYTGFNINGFELGLDPDMSNVAVGNHTVSYWSVDRMQTAVDNALLIGATLVEPPKNVGGKIEVAVIADPFGNHIGFITGT